MNSVKFESTQWVKDLGVAIAFNLKFSQQCKNAAGKTYRMLGFINRNFSFIDKDIFISIHNSLFRSHLEFAIQSRYPVHPPNKGHDKTRCPVKGHEDVFILCNKSFEVRLASLDLFSLEKCRLRCKLTECFKILKCFTNVDANKLFSTGNSPKTRTNDKTTKM